MKHILLATAERLHASSIGRHLHPRVTSYLQECDPATVARFRKNPELLKRALLHHDDFKDVHRHIRWKTPDVIDCINQALQLHLED